MNDAAQTPAPAPRRPTPLVLALQASMAAKGLASAADLGPVVGISAGRLRAILEEGRPPGPRHRARLAQHLGRSERDIALLAGIDLPIRAKRRSANEERGEWGERARYRRIIAALLSLVAHPFVQRALQGRQPRRTARRPLG